VTNKRSPGNLADRLITAFEKIFNVALFYHVGNGQINIDDQFRLSLATIGIAQPQTFFTKYLVGVA